MTPALLLALWISNFGHAAKKLAADRIITYPPLTLARRGNVGNYRVAGPLPAMATLSEAVAPPSGSFTHPPLFGGDLTLFHSMVTLITEHDGYRMLVVGPTRNWILSLRLEGIRAFGIAEEPWSWDPFYVIAKYGDMPFRSSAFKVISVVAEGGVALIFEADRLLVPSGFLTLQTYDEFRMYGLLKRLGYSFMGHSVAGQHVWQKRDWEEAA